MSRSVRAIYQSPYTRYKAAQLTQESNFAISVVEDLKIYWNNGQDYTNALYDIGSAVTRTGVHLQLSNSFEQWRINSVTIKFQLKTFSGDVINLYEDVEIKQYIDFYTAVRRGKKTDNSIEELESNSSYEQVTWPADGLGGCIPLKRTIHNSSLRMASTKMTAPFPYITYGLRIHGNDHFMENKIFQTPFVISMQLQAKCSYRGVRLDKSNVLTSINPNVVNYSTTTNWFIPTLASLIYTRGQLGPDPDEQMELMNRTWIYQTSGSDIRLEPGQALVIIIPHEFQANLYTFTSTINKRATSALYQVATGYYYVHIPNIFQNYENTTAYLYFYSTNNKLIAMQQVYNNSLITLTKQFTIHMDIQQLLTK